MVQGILLWIQTWAQSQGLRLGFDQRLALMIGALLPADYVG
jgi:hypothetical protein